MTAWLDPEMEALLRRVHESERRSRERRVTRRARRRNLIVGLVAAVLAVAVGGLAIEAPRLAGDGGVRQQGALQGTVSAAEREVPPDAGGKRRRKVPSAAGLKSARNFADGRTGVVSLAVVNSEGGLRGDREIRRYAAASVVKAMLLAAEVRRLKKAGAGIDSATDSLLTSMITVSDNGAADSIYARVGDQGLFDVAHRAGMKRFTVAGHWGNAQITAADMARFFGDLDHVLVRRHREYAKGLLGSVVESQRWGIPAAAGDRWAVRFKGGWLPDHALVHQAAELRERDGNRELAIVVLTDDQPSFTYGIETVRGVAERLLSRSGDP